MADSDTELALNALRDTLRAVDVRPSDRVRAAEAILRLAQGNGPGASDLIELSDDALLLIARGEGGTPPERGPTVPALETVPSDAVQPPGLALPAKRDGLKYGADGIGHGDERNRGQANPFMQRGPKEDPAPKAPRGVPLAMGPKEDPDPWT
jgi:hypothetical protein